MTCIMHTSIVPVQCKDGVVLTSTPTSTGRDYACPFETVVITCSEGIGGDWSGNILVILRL